MTNRLHIRARHLDLDLEGEAEYIEQAYEAVRIVLMERFRESIALREKPPELAPMSRATDELPVVDGRQDPDADRTQHVNVVLCNEVYHKIFLVELAELADNRFRRSIDLEQVNRIYINRDEREHFEEFFSIGKVLWRELTSAGKAAVKGSG